MIQASLSFEKGLPLSVSSRHVNAPWLALARVKGLGAVSFKKLTARFLDPTAAFSAAPTELEQVEGLHRDAIDGIVAFADWAGPAVPRQVYTDVIPVRQQLPQLPPYARVECVTMDPKNPVTVTGKYSGDDTVAAPVAQSHLQNRALPDSGSAQSIGSHGAASVRKNRSGDSRSDAA